MKYNLLYSDEANRDLEELAYTIAIKYSSPITSFHYVQGIIDTINNMVKNPEIYPVRFNLSLKDDKFVRRVNYKKMAIIYSVNKNVVTIHRIIAASLITEY